MTTILVNADLIQLDLDGNMDYEIQDFENKIGSKVTVEAISSSIKVNNSAGLAKSTEANSMMLVTPELSIPESATTTIVDKDSFRDGSIELVYEGEFENEVATLKLDNSEDCLRIILNGEGKATIKIPFEVKKY